MSSVVLLGLMTLDLHGTGDDAFSLEGLWLEVDVFCLLEALQASFLTNLSQIVHELQTNGSILAELLESALNIHFLGHFLDCLAMRDGNNDDEGLGGLAMNEYFCQLVALHIGVLHLLSGHILALLQLEDVFLSVDDAHCPRLGAQCSDVACLQPPVGSECLPCLGLVAEISHEDARSSHPNLSSGSGVALCVPIGREIVHFGNVDQLEFEVALDRKRGTVGPPTCLTSGSLASLMSMAPVVSVCP